MQTLEEGMRGNRSGGDTKEDVQISKFTIYKSRCQVELNLKTYFAFRTQHKKILYPQVNNIGVNNFSAKKEARAGKVKRFAADRGKYTKIRTWHRCWGADRKGVWQDDTEVLFSTFVRHSQGWRRKSFAKDPERYFYNVSRTFITSFTLRLTLKWLRPLPDTPPTCRISVAQKSRTRDVRKQLKSEIVINSRHKSTLIVVHLPRTWIRHSERTFVKYQKPR